MPPIELPTEVAEVIREFRTCEFTTLAKDGTPITWPTLPFYDPASGQFVVTTSIALPQKVFNIRRNSRVALLFSEPRASGLANPPAVLVQGDAVAPDEIVTSIEGSEAGLCMVFQRQPGSAIYCSSPLMRKLCDWYYMRLIMTITPRRLLWWPQRDFGRAPQVLELAPVAARPAVAPGPRPAFEEWPALLRQLAQYPSAVVTGLDAQGYPFSVRCAPQPDAASRTLRLDLPPDAPIQAGPAGLLCHSHDDRLWNQTSFGLRGTLARDERGWLIEPHKLIPGIRPDPVALFKFILSCRRNAAEYLARRGLARPPIPWADIIAVKRQALGK